MDYKLINTSLTPDRLSSLTNEERLLLCDELRDKIINTVSSNGGHLASNLGVVELTVALLSVFDYEKDKIIFDVGHQSYSYKLLTGRYDRFDTLRKKGGISGFPRISESQYDVFDTGHSSTSVSAGLGFARARDILASDNYVISVIGDGALTGGLAYEALNDLGHTHKKMIVILNDNEMSIDKNVGGISAYLKKLRISKGYISAKRSTESILNKIPLLGKPLVSLILKIKSFVRFLVNKKGIPSMFEDFGLVYYGPIDGHDIKRLTKALNAVKDINDPVLLHVITKKGKGYRPAEKDPSSYHGVAPFDMEYGVIKKNPNTYTKVFADELLSIAKSNKNVVAITAAMTQGTGLDKFELNLPGRFFDCGIAEEHAVTMAGGLSREGIIPVVAIYSSFLQRAYDEIMHDVCFMNNHVVFAIDRSGFVGDDGHTHNGLCDISYMNMMPNMTILCPNGYADLRNSIRYAIEEVNGPVAIRYPRGKSEEVSDMYDDYEELTKPHVLYNTGDEFTIISVGAITSECYKAFDILEVEGHKGKLIEITLVKPILHEEISKLTLGSTVFTVEEGIISGGFGQNLKELLPDQKIYNLGVTDMMIRAQSIDDQRDQAGLSARKIADFILKHID